MNTFILFSFFCLSTLYAQDGGLFDYSPSPHQAELVKKYGLLNYEVYEGSLKAIDPLTREEVSIKFDYYKTKKKLYAPLTLVYPSLSKEIPIVENLLADKLARKGHNVIIARLNEDIADLSRPLTKLDTFFIRSTIHLRMVLDKALQWKENDPQRVFSVGVSLGGIRAALALGVEPRIKAAALYVTGGNIPEIMATSKVKLLLDYKNHWKKKLQLSSDKEFENAIRQNMNVELLDYAHLRSKDEVLMVMGTKDKKVPYANQLKLWEAFGKPDHILVNKQHRLAGASFLVNFSQVLTFFERQ